MRFIELYLGTKYEVIGWNSIRDMVHWLVFRHLLENLTLTFDLDLLSRSLSFGSSNVPYWVVTWYKYEVCGWNSKWDKVHCLVFGQFWTLDLDLWPWPLTKVMEFQFKLCTSWCHSWMPSIKYVCQILFLICPISSILFIFLWFWWPLADLCDLDLDLVSRSYIFSLATHSGKVLCQVWSM